MNVCCFLSKCPIRCVNASNRQRVYHGLVIRYVVEDRKSPSIRVFYRPQQKINWTYWQLLTDEKCMLEQSSNERTEVHTKKKSHTQNRQKTGAHACLPALFDRAVYTVIMKRGSTPFPKHLYQPCVFAQTTCDQRLIRLVYDHCLYCWFVDPWLLWMHCDGLKWLFGMQ